MFVNYGSILTQKFYAVFLTAKFPGLWQRGKFIYLVGQRVIVSGVTTGIMATVYNAVA